MDIDFIFENDLVQLTIVDSQKEKRKKQKKVLMLAEENLRVLTIDRINGQTGDC